MITHPECGWTAWINSDRPTVGSGDLETLSKIRRIHKFCDSPALIECRDVHTRTPVQDIHQKVSCDLSTGLKCLNWDNNGDCSDFEVRFFCPCLCKFVYLRNLIPYKHNIFSINQGHRYTSGLIMISKSNTRFKLQSFTEKLRKQFFI